MDAIRSTKTVCAVSNPVYLHLKDAGMSGSHEAVLTVWEAHSISLYEAYAESLESENAIALAAMQGRKQLLRP